MTWSSACRGMLQAAILNKSVSVMKLRRRFLEACVELNLEKALREAVDL